MYHIFLIHFSAVGYLDYFHVLGIVNSASVNIGVHISFQIMVFPPDTHPGVKLQDHIVTVFSFLRNLHTVLHSGYTCLHPHQQCRKSFFTTPILAFIVCRHFDDGHSDLCEVILHYYLDFHFSNN